MIWQMIEDWFRGILTDGILSNLSGLFDSVNTEVGEIATQVGTTPAGWNAGIFNMIRSRVDLPDPDGPIITTTSPC